MLMTTIYAPGLVYFISFIEYHYLYLCGGELLPIEAILKALKYWLE